MSIYGSNFVNGATLSFVSPSGSLYLSNSSKLTFVSSGQINYGFNNGGEAGTWSVRVTNPDSQQSSPLYFSVTSSVPAPSVSSVSPTSMTADGVGHNLTIYGSNFQSGNIVQFQWGVGSGSGVWNNGSAPSINSSTQMSTTMNPGTVNDTIYVRVCRSSSQTSTSDCSSGTQFVTVTASVPAPSVSSVSPTSMTADGVGHSLTIYGSNFQSGNVVQFKWGAGSGSGVWNTGSTPSINSSTQMSTTMNPGTVNDTIYVRVCRSSSQTSTSDCSSGTQFVTVTASVPAPSVSSVSPTSMTADGVGHSLTIYGSNFQSGNIVQFKWGSGSGSGVWNTGSAPSINSSTQMSTTMNPGTVNDTIYVRVCRSSSQTSTSDCSSGTQFVTVTASVPAPSVSSVSPASMTADGVGHSLTIYGSNFQSGNVVQFKWGAGSGSGVWNNGTAPSINSSTQMSTTMNPGTVNDTIYVRVCRSSSQTSTSDCSSGTQFVTVTASVPAPSVSSVSPTSMTADGVGHNLTIYGSNFQSGNVVQFKWGAGSGSGVWNNGTAPSINSSTQMSTTMNPGTVNDTIYVRVCRSSSQTSTSDCSSGTQFVTVTASVPTPSVSSVSPTSMTADGVGHNLTIYGSNFQSGNIVQFKWGAGSGSGVWNNGSTPSINSSTQMSTTMNPGTVNDTIYVRVCRSSSQTTTSDCSSGTQFVTVTASVPAPSVSSVSPTSMTADGVGHSLTIYGSNFQSGNIVQFKWGAGSGSGVWNNGSTPSISSSTQMSTTMNPGTVNDTIYVRVCRSSSQTTTSDCSSGTQFVTVTASSTPTAPSVSSVSPTSMTADGVGHNLTIYGSNFQSGNIVQFKWGAGSGSGVWNNGTAPSISSSTQMSTTMNPGTVNDTIYVRVCRSSSQTTTSDCSSGTQFVTVTASVPAPSVSSVSPTSMTADGVGHSLTIYGSNFQSGNIVQFKWGAGSGSGVWNNGSTPSISSSTQMSTTMNPGTVNDTIYVRVCRSSSQTTTSDCSSGTQFVTVTASSTPTAPSVSSVSPTSMTADGVGHNLTIYGSNFQSGNIVQFKWGAGSGSGVWNNGTAPSISSSTQMSTTMNPGTVNDTIYVRVCRSSSQTTTSDCSSGTQFVTVTASSTPTAPSVSSVSPTSMTADGVGHNLTIYGSNFQSGNIVQFKWGAGSGSGVWNNGTAPSISSSTQMSTTMNPGTVNDTIYVRVCRSSSQTTTSDCSSGTQFVTVTASSTPTAPSVSSVSPTSMTADGVGHNLTIYGSNFQSGNVVQFKWGVGLGNGVWNNGTAPSISSSTQISTTMKPGSVSDTIYVRVCRSATETTATDCSSGTQFVTVTVTTATITGTVRDSSTSIPIAGATLMFGNASATSDTSGVYSFASVGCSTSALRASKSGYQPLSLSYTPSTCPGVNTQDLKLVPNSSTATLQGIVLDDITGNAITGATVTYGSTPKTSDANGRFAFDGVSCERDVLTVSHAGYVRFSESYAPSCTATSTKEVRLSRNVGTGVLQVSVGNRFQPITNADVAFGEAVPSSSSKGVYTLSNVPCTEALLVVTAVGYQKHSAPYTPTNCPGTSTVDVSLDSSDMTIALDFDVPASVVVGQKVTFDPHSTSGFTWHWTFGNGHESREPQPMTIYDTPGKFFVTATRTNGTEQTSVTKTIDVVSRSCSGCVTIRGNVTLGFARLGVKADGRWNRYVEAVPESGIALATMTGANGDYTLSVPPGGYTIRAVVQYDDFQSDGTPRTTVPLQATSREGPRNFFLSTLLDFDFHIVAFIHGWQPSQTVGFGSGSNAFAGWRQWMEREEKPVIAFTPLYESCYSGYDTDASTVESALAADMNGVATATPDFDLVAHSKGGLVTRALLDQFKSADPVRKAKHFIMLGTPNNGTPAASLAPCGLSTEAISEFNSTYSSEPFPETKAIAGTADYFSDQTLVCGNSPCDGVVLARDVFTVPWGTLHGIAVPFNHTAFGGLDTAEPILSLILLPYLIDGQAFPKDCPSSLPDGLNACFLGRGYPSACAPSEFPSLQNIDVSWLAPTAGSTAPRAVTARTTNSQPDCSVGRSEVRPDAVSGSPAAYDIYRASDSPGTVQALVKIGSTDGATLHFVDVIPSSGAFVYSVAADYEAGTSELVQSPPVGTLPKHRAAGSPGNPQAPLPFVLAANAHCGATGPAVALTWAPSAGASSYTVFRDGAAYSPALSLAQTSFDDTSVAEGESHTYFVRAANSKASTDSKTVQVQVGSGICQ